MKTKLFYLGLMATCSIFAQDPTVFNDQFTSLAKAGSSNLCSCSGWVNKDLGDQAESSAEITPGNDAVKFDNYESDLIYQEISVLPNTNYKLEYSYQFKSPITIDSQLEIRILKGSAYEDGYTPTYYTTAGDAPDTGYGYKDITVAENVSNNIISVIESDPGNTDYNIKSFTFNSGSETSIAILARGIGRPTEAPSDSKPYAWSSGDHEVRLDYVALTNESELSTNAFELSNNIKLYPNPAKDYVTIQAKNIKISSVDVFSVLGTKILSAKTLSNNRLNVSGLSKGIYLLSIKAEGNSITRKIIIE